ncbi:hypothetical protein [Ferrimonas marina]|uniref:Uncharacterized protein n=1 Tax=Ferrimonas marina TaxID=299255 RepID=A0A1M5NV92_9GAMM|nr:hypothetical protein [Ferrimonas marina]SHG93109.1 hypothetical protein SAMN02745129_1181 [Ferrimonas marina]
MIRCITGALLAMSIAAVAAPLQNEFVEIAVQVDQQAGTFELICTPKKVASELPSGWVATCNALGKQLLQLAVDSGMTVQVVDQPFGQAGEFAQFSTDSLPDNVIPRRIISPSFGE